MASCIGQGRVMDGGSENVILGLWVWLGFSVEKKKKQKKRKNKEEKKGK